MAKRPRDPNEMAARIVGEATGERERTEPDEKDEARAAGGAKGGKARADKLVGVLEDWERRGKAAQPG